MRLAVAALLVLSLAACGGSSSNTQTTSPEAAAKAWAGGVCLAFTSWQTDLAHAGSSLANNPTKDQLVQSVQDAQSATTKLRDTLKGIGAPPEESKPAQQAIDTLRSELKTEADAIHDLIKDVSNLQEAAVAAPKVQAEVAKMQTTLKNAGAALEGVPSGTIKQGFQDAPNCKSLGS